MQRLLGQHEIHVLDGHRLDPLRVLARGRIVAGVVLQVAVVPGDVAFQQIARLLRACRVAGAQLVDVEIALEEEVAVFILEIHEAAGGTVFVALANRGMGVAAEVLRTLAAYRQQGIGEHAQVVLCVGIRQAIAEAAEIGCLDVHHAWFFRFKWPICGRRKAKSPLSLN
jgi:hypothetical protein